MRTLFLLTLSALATAPSAPLLNDCAQCSAKALCADHAAIERRQLPELRERMRKSNAADRIVLLRQAAALTAEHENAPSEAVVRFLAESCDDENPKVCKAAIDLLGPGQHVDSSRVALAHVLEQSMRVLEIQQPELELPKPGRGDSIENYDKKVERYVRDVARLGKKVDTYEEAFAVQGVAYVLGESCVARLMALGGASDEELAANYFRHLRARTKFRPGTLLDPLLAFRTRTAFQVVIESFDEYAGDGNEVESTGADGAKNKSLDWGGLVHERLLAAVEAQGLRKPEFHAGAPVREVWRAWLASGEVAFRER